MGFQPIRVIIADDHPIVRDGLRATLEKSPQIQLVGVATTFAEVVDLLKTILTHVVVLDLSGMGGAPLTVVARIRREYPDVVIVVFSSIVDLAPELLQAGVCGYIVKEELSEQLLDAIWAARRGQRFLSPLVEAYVMRGMSVRQQRQLTPKELAVLKLLAQGLGTVEIAGQVQVDPRTCQNHITNMLHKIGCEGRLQLISWYKRMYDDEGGRNL